MHVIVDIVPAPVADGFNAQIVKACAHSALRNVQVLHAVERGRDAVTMGTVLRMQTKSEVKLLVVVTVHPLQLEGIDGTGPRILAERDKAVDGRIGLETSSPRVAAIGPGCARPHGKVVITWAKRIQCVWSACGSI